MQSDIDTRQLKTNFECKKNVLCQLEEKLSTYEDDLSKKKEMQNQVCKLKEWLEEIQHKSNKMNNDMINNLDVQTEKLNKVEATECMLRNENKKLLDVNDRTGHQLSDLKKQEQKLPMEIEDLKIRKDCIQNDICNAKVEVEKNTHLVESSSKTLQCREKECCELRVQLEEFITTYNQLTETCTQLTTAIEYTTKDITAMKSRLKLTAQKLKHEEDTLSDELNIRCQKHHMLETELCEAKRMIDDEKCKIQNSQTSTAEFRDACERNNREMNSKIRNLKEENCIKAESLCCLQNRIVEQSVENECTTSEINSLKKQVIANECLIERMRRSAEVFEQQKNSKCEQLEKDTNLLLCDIQEKEMKIANLEHKARELREKLKNPESTCQSIAPCDADITVTAMDKKPELRLVEKLGETSENTKFISDLKEMYCSEGKSKICAKTA
ncbi:Hypothetical protein CINCED_3A019488 [Cinara cedri]|uniref:Uncharacterized protein n=1 Tax=Cinara cedri TaxID=506608 RepID=A0A5E4NH83_9HEMI|nr:Hypothetical protein CINCED_3A019488 [Cinara cedri]